VLLGGLIFFGGPTAARVKTTPRRYLGLRAMGVRPCARPQIWVKERLVRTSSHDTHSDEEKSLREYSSCIQRPAHRISGQQ